MKNEEKEFSFDEFKKSELFKRCGESFDKQPENPSPESNNFQITKLSDDEVLFAIETIAEKFR